MYLKPFLFSFRKNIGLYSYPGTLEWQHFVVTSSASRTFLIYHNGIKQNINFGMFYSALPILLRCAKTKIIYYHISITSNNPIFFRNHITRLCTNNIENKYYCKLKHYETFSQLEVQRVFLIKSGKLEISLIVSLFFARELRCFI